MAKRAELTIGGRMFVFLAVAFANRETHLECYVVDDDAIEMFVGYVGALHRADESLRRLDELGFAALLGAPYRPLPWEGPRELAWRRKHGTTATDAVRTALRAYREAC